MNCWLRRWIIRSRKTLRLWWLFIICKGFSLIRGLFKTRMPWMDLTFRLIWRDERRKRFWLIITMRWKVTHVRRRRSSTRVFYCIILTNNRLLWSFVSSLHTTTQRPNLLLKGLLLRKLAVTCFKRLEQTLEPKSNSHTGCNRIRKRQTTGTMWRRRIQCKSSKPTILLWQSKRPAYDTVHEDGSSSSDKRATRRTNKISRNYQETNNNVHSDYCLRKAAGYKCGSIDCLSTLIRALACKNKTCFKLSDYAE